MSEGMTETTNPATNSWNILAIAGFALAFIAGFPGAVLGHIGYSQAKKRGQRGRGLALAAIIIGWLMTVVVLSIGALVIWWLASHGQELSNTLG